jgi:integrase
MILKEELERVERIGEYVFMNPKTKDRYGDTKDRFTFICNKCGIIGLVFHDLRHTAATRMVENGVDLG